MTSVQFPLMWRPGSQVVVPAAVVPALLRRIADQLARWPDQGADADTVTEVRALLSQVADQIDLDCIEVTSELDGED